MAKRHRVNQSALIPRTLEQRLKHLREVELEELDRRGYLARPQREEQFRVWEHIACWPEHEARCCESAKMVFK